MRISSIRLMLAVAFLLVPSARAEPQDETKRLPEEELRRRVEALAKLSNVDQRPGVDDYFALAEICAEDGRVDEAISYYEMGLRIDPWRLEHQLALAGRFQSIGLKDQAVEKAQVVYRYAEYEDLIDHAERLLADLGVPPTSRVQTQAARGDAKATIVVVPIGKVNRRVLAELMDALREQLGIEFSVCEDSLALGPIGRSYADRYVSLLIDSVKARLSPGEMQGLLTELALTEAALDDPHTQPKFLEAVLKKEGRPSAEIDAFREVLAKLEHEGQYDAKEMLRRLRDAYPLDKTAKVVGCLGVTEADLFADDFNFLYGWARQGHAVMSYHQFTAAFNQTPPNRPRLIERATKQAISSTFFILGIPRCTSPVCARAYPHSLTELDQKTGQLCPSCQRELEWALSRSR